MRRNKEEHRHTNLPEEIEVIHAVGATQLLAGVIMGAVIIIGVLTALINPDEEAIGGFIYKLLN